MRKKIVKIIFYFLPYSKEYKRFFKTLQQASYLDFLKYKIGFNKRYWPAPKNCTIAHSDKIYIGKNSVLGRSGSYIQGLGQIYIGDYTRIAVNVGIISSNHDLYDHNISHKSKIEIGDYCWIGMNSVILPGVTLGTRTIVAAGSVVTKSFPEGFCVIGGSPAKIIKTLDKELFKPWVYEEEFYGYVPKEKFEKTKFYHDNKINKS